jgi:hypothetical protein
VQLEEVALMEIYTIERPSLLPVLCAPTSAAWLPLHESIVVTAAQRAQRSQVHQVPSQAFVYAGNGTTGFVGSNSTLSAAKRMTDGASGVPPRGRPV